MTGGDNNVCEVLWKALDLDRYQNNKEVNSGLWKKDKSSYNCGGMAYKVIKIDSRAKNIASYICNHGTKLISWLVLDRIRGVKCWWGAGPQTFDLVKKLTHQLWITTTTHHNAWNLCRVEERVTQAIAALDTRENVSRNKIAQEFCVPVQRLRSQLNRHSPASTVWGFHGKKLYMTNYLI